VHNRNCLRRRGVSKTRRRHAKSEGYRAEVEACLKAEICLKLAGGADQAYARAALLELAEEYLDLAEQLAAKAAR
jgi:hypothetical protein